MEGDDPAELPIRICFSRVYIASLRQIRRLPGASRVDCTDIVESDWMNNSADHLECLDAYIRHAEMIARYQLHATDNIYVHCHAGQVRSVITVGVYLLRFVGLSLDDTWGHLLIALGDRQSERHRNRVLGWLHAYLANRHPRPDRR